MMFDFMHVCEIGVECAISKWEDCYRDAGIEAEGGGGVWEVMAPWSWAWEVQGPIEKAAGIIEKGSFQVVHSLLLSENAVPLKAWGIRKENIHDEKRTTNGIDTAGYDKLETFQELMKEVDRSVELEKVEMWNFPRELDSIIDVGTQLERVHPLHSVRSLYDRHPVLKSGIYAVQFLTLRTQAMPSKKMKRDSKQPPETEESQDDTMSQLLGATIAAINTTKDLVPIDLVKGILGTIANILIIAQSVINNKSDFQAIASKCETIREILESATKDATEDNLQGYLGHALSQLNKLVNRINSNVASKKEQGIWHRLLSVTIDRNRIAGWEKDLDQALMLFRTEAIAGIANRVDKLTLGPRGNTRETGDLLYRPPMPPSWPSMFYGHEDLIAELTNLIINGEHITLIGLGGMGKSSLAKAILNEPLVTETFADQRFFMTYDGLDPLTITFETFMTRFVAALGIESAGADPVRQISTLLHSANALVVLDNAETFEEASASSALREIPQAIAEIADIHGVILILTSHSRRSAPNVPWITKDIPPLDSSSAQEAFFRIYRLASLGLGIPPTFLNLLANAAQQNGWSPPMLLERWKDQHSAVLDHGEGKLQSLSYTKQLSLSSLSIQKLGEEAWHVLAVIAFLPQGLNESCPSAASSKCSHPFSTMYHLNIEHVVAFNLAHLTKKTYRTCSKFLECLQWHLPRPTTLTPTVANIVENSSMWTLKAHCLSTLVQLYKTLSQVAEAARAYQAAEALYLTASDPESMGNCLITHADLLRCQGCFIQSQNLLEDLQHSDSWKSLSKTMKARAWDFLDAARMYTFTASADKLFVKSSEDRIWGLHSKVWHWRAKFYYGRDAVQVKTHLEDLFLQCTSAGNVFGRRDAFVGLVDIAFCEGRLSNAMDNLQTLVEMCKGQYSECVLWYTIQKAVVASNQGDHALARELIHKASEPFQFFVLRNTRTFLHRSHYSARIKLAAGEYDVAKSHFTAAIEGCDMQGDLHIKAFSVRGLGEIAFVHSNFALAAEHFADTSCVPFLTLPDKFKGWTLFLEGRSPFANVT
ncbi:hypothetical protein EDB19DRAFT_1948328 [Suillus lakei]|nr:hypothetical protein EDB19DRAFT_1948328 [Suillus lakei]